MAERLHALLLRPLQNTRHRVQSLIEALQRRTKREPDKVVARRAEEVATVGRVDVEEYAGNDDTFLLEQFLEEGLDARMRAAQ